VCCVILAKSIRPHKNREKYNAVQEEKRGIGGGRKGDSPFFFSLLGQVFSDRQDKSQHG
jgi:hypothetical protein